MAQVAWLRPEPKVVPTSAALLDNTIVFTGMLAPTAEALFLNHVISGSILFPGVGYLEMAFAADPT